MARYGTGFDVVFESRGVYKFSPCDLDTRSVVFRGPCGGQTGSVPGVRIEPMTPDQPHIFRVCGEANAAVGVGFEGLIFSGGTSRASCSGIVLETGVGFYTHNVEFKRLKHGVSIEPVGRVLSPRIVGGRISDCEIGINVTDSGLGSDATTACMSVVGVTIDKCDQGIRCDPTTRQMSVRDCCIQSSKWASIAVTGKGSRLTLDTCYLEAPKVTPPAVRLTLYVAEGAEVVSINSLLGPVYVDETSGAKLTMLGGLESNRNDDTGQVVRVTKLAAGFPR
jgi:hypothetical protein